MRAFPRARERQALTVILVNGSVRSFDMLPMVTHV
jgi:hypothetical protein